MRVFVAGAAGVIGARLVPQLVARGHDVIATTRRPAKLGQLSAMGADARVVDGLDRAAVRDAVVQARPHVVVHQMTALAGTADMKHFDKWFTVTNELRTHGTDNLLAAARAAEVHRFVAQSYTGWNNTRTGDLVKTENDALDREPARAQRNSLAALRHLEQVVRAASLEGVVLRYGGFYGPGASDGFAQLVRQRKVPIVGTGAGVWSWIHLDDAAAATVAAVERGAGGIYNIVDDEPAAVADWLPHLAEAVGAKPPRHVPGWVGRLAIGEVGLRWMTESRGAANRKAKRELGWRLRYPSWRQGFCDGLLTADTLDADRLATLIGPAPKVTTTPADRRPAAS